MMNDSIKIAAAFVVGAVLGAVVTNRLLQAKYQEIADEEIASVKEVYSSKEKVLTNNIENITNSKAEKISSAREKPSLNEYMKGIREGRDRKNYSTTSVEPEEEPKPDNYDDRDDPDTSAVPYVIAPEDFATQGGYDTTSLTYFEDGIVADEDDRMVTDLDNLIGPDALSHFGEFEDDSVFVRNDKLKMDFEILKDLRNYSDVTKHRPDDLNDQN